MVKENEPSNQTESEKKKLTRLQQIVHSCFDNSSKFFQQRLKWKNRYLGVDEDLDRRKAHWQARFVHTYPHQAVELKGSFFTQALKGNGVQPFYVVEPWDFNSEDKALANTRLLQYQLARTPVLDTMYKVSKDLSIYGTGILKTFWDYQSIDVPQKPKQVFDIDENQNLFVKSVKPPPVKRVMKDQPDTMVIEPNDFWPDPSATSLENARYVCHRTIMPFSKLKALEKKKGSAFGRYKNVDMVKKTSMPMRQFADQHSSLTRDDRLLKDLNANFRNADPNNPMVEIVEIWEPGGKVSTIANNEVLLEHETILFEHLKYPFVVLTNEPITGEFWGLSDFQIAQKLLDYVDEHQSQLLDNNSQTLKGFALVERGIGAQALKDLEEAEPGSKIVVNDLNAIKWERPPSPDSSAAVIQENLLQQARQAMSVTEILQGVAPPSNIRSTGGLELLAQVGQVRLVVTVDRLAEQLRTLGKQWIALNQQFLDESVLVPIIGAVPGTESYTRVSPEDIPMDVDVRVRLGSLAQGNRELRVQQMLQIHNLAQNIPGYNAIRAMKEIASVQGGFEDPTTLFLLDEQDAAQLQTQNFLAELGKGPLAQAPQLSGGVQTPSASNLPDPNQVAQGNANAATPSVPSV